MLDKLYPWLRVVLAVACVLTMAFLFKELVNDPQTPKWAVKIVLLFALWKGLEYTVEAKS